MLDHIWSALDIKQAQFVMWSMNTSMSLTLIGIYIYSTYHPLEFASNQLIMVKVYNIYAFIASFYFLFQFALTYNPSSIFSMPKISDIIEVATTVPYIVVALYYGILNNDFEKVFIMTTRMIVMFRLFLLDKYMEWLVSEHTLKVAGILMTIIGLVMCIAGIIQMIENYMLPGGFNYPVHEFHNVFFFVMTTVSTIGYGSSIVTTWGWIAIIILLLISLAIVPSKASEIVKLFSQRSEYATNRYKTISKVPHVILIGSISSKAAQNFFIEYFCEDHGNETRHCLILKNQRPDRKLEMLIKSTEYVSNVFYFEGDLSEYNLKRC